eukprot:398366-Prymnesium_polylepis.1
MEATERVGEGDGGDDDGEALAARRDHGRHFGAEAADCLEVRDDAEVAGGRLQQQQPDDLSLIHISEPTRRS